MKIKTLTAVLILFVGIILFAFTSKNENEGEIKITVTSDKPTKFDMFQNQDQTVKTFKGLSTPYTYTLQSSDAKFIFKQQKLKTLKIKAEKKNSRVTADWPITVLIIKNDGMEIFGLD